MAGAGLEEPGAPIVTFESGTAVANATATSVTQAMPSGIQDGDGIVAFVSTRSAFSAPAGWTIKHTATFAYYTGVFTQYVHCVQKDTVLASDSGQNVTFQQAVSGRISSTIAHLSSTVGSPRVGQVTKAEIVNQTEGFGIPISALTADRGTEVALLGTSATLQETSWTYPPATGMTCWHSTTMDIATRVQGSYQSRVNSESTPTAVNSNDADEVNNSCGAVMVLVRGDVFGVTVTDSIGQSSSFDLGGSTYNLEHTDSVSIDARSILGGQFFEATATDVMSLAETLLETLPLQGSVTDGIVVAHTDPLPAILRPAGLVIESIGVGHTYDVRMGLTLVDAIPLSMSMDPEMTFHVTVAQAIQTAESIRRGQAVSLSDVAQMAYVLTAAAAARVTESLNLASVISPTATYGLTVNQIVSLQDSWRRFFGGDISESVGMLSVMVPKLNMSDTVSDGIGLAPEATPTFILRVTAAESVQIDAEEILNGIYAGTISEDFEIGAAYLSPGNSFTTWVVNTKTGATTEYDDYVFNSFAKIGHKYVGASDTGLYELQGADDDGADIIARIKSGNLQFTGSRFTTIVTAYLGVRGAGDFVLRLEAGDGKTYDYAVSAKNLETTRVRMGKGLRARYFSFELISTGQDFDLETIEFVPISAKRRV